MTNTAFIRNLYSKCKMHGSGDAQVVISDGELLSLISIAINDLGWSFDELGIDACDLPNNSYYQIPLSWFDSQEKLDI